MQSFFGKINFMQIFVSDFAEIFKPIQPDDKKIREIQVEIY
jgi:hypothetical protein